MKLYLSTLALAGALGVAGCTGGPTPSANVTSIVAQAQQLTQQACSVLPTAESIAQLVAKNDPVYATASAIADAICGAVAGQKVGGALKAHPIAIDGVQINFQ